MLHVLQTYLCHNSEHSYCLQAHRSGARQVTLLPPATDAEYNQGVLEKGLLDT